jgi:hypothetical protein
MLQASSDESIQLVSTNLISAELGIKFFNLIIIYLEQLKYLQLNVEYR